MAQLRGGTTIGGSLAMNLIHLTDGNLDLNIDTLTVNTEIDLSAISDTTSTPSHVYIEVGTDGHIYPISWANFQNKITDVGTLATLTVTADINGNVTGSSGSCTGNASTATNLASIPTTFNGTYSMVVNASGAIYSHTGITYNGSTNTLAVSALTNGSDAVRVPVITVGTSAHATPASGDLWIDTT